MTELDFRKSLGYEEDIYYHYCSLNSLYGIITSQSFWLTCLESTNDSKELKLGKSLLIEAINQLKEEYKGTKYFLFFDKIIEEANNQDFKKFNHPYKYYGLSLVKNKDSLTHWERYGNNSMGVCIGINLKMLDYLFETYNLPEMCSGWLNRSKIYYSSEEQLKYVKDSMIAKLDDSIKVKLFDINNFQDNENYKFILNSFYYSILHMIEPIFKDLGFSDENEYRLYLEEGEAENNMKFFKQSSSHCKDDGSDLFLQISKNIFDAATTLHVLKENKKYSVFTDSIRSYYSLNLSEIWSDALIHEVIIGPKCTQNKKELKAFLKANNLCKTKVSISEIPIR